MNNRYRLIISICLILSVGCGYNPAYNDGQEIGYVVSVSRPTLFRNTLEGALLVDPVINNKGDFIDGRGFAFTITNGDDIAKCEQLEIERREVILDYHQLEYFWLTRTSSGTYFVNIEPTGKPPIVRKED